MQVPEIKTRSTLRLRVLAAVGSLLIVMSLGAPATALATGGATHLVVTGLTNAAAGTAQTATVTAKDGTEATDATYVGTVTLTSTDGAAVLESAKALVAGVGTFTVTLKTAGSQTVTANGTGSITGLQTVTVTAGTATKLAFGVQPTSTASGASISPSITVLAQDAFGNTDTTSAASVTLAIGTNPSSGSLSGTQIVAAASGVATFSGLSIDKVGTGYTLTAAATGLTGATSSAFNITASKLAFGVQPTSTASGASISPSITVLVQDAAGSTVTTATNSVTLAIGTNPGSGTLSGTQTVAAIAGVATFAGLSIDKAGIGYTLTASAAGLTGATSTAFNITFGVASKLGFLQQPGGGAIGTVWSTQPLVAVQDAAGNTVTTATTSITLAIQTDPGTGTLSGTNPKAAVSGVATFTDLSINNAGTGYTLRASGGGLTTADSSTFNITSGTGSKLAFTTQPGGGTGGTAWGSQPFVTVQDAAGNTVTGAANAITLAITTPAGATLTCTSNPKAAVAGVAVFSGCNIDKAGTGYTLTATATGLTNAISSTFSITVGTASKLGFTTQPGGGTIGTAWSAQPVVAIQDAGGNTVTSATNSITLAIGSNPGSGALTCTTNPLTTSSGVAAFAGCRIDVAGTGYTLTASSPPGGPTAATSGPFAITSGTGTKLAFTTQPGGGTGGTAWGVQPVVTIQDTASSTVTAATNSISLAITTPAGATLTCTSNPKAAVAGVATFAGCRIDRSGTYTLTASASGLTSATSSTFTVSVGTPSRLGFTTQPGGGAIGTAWSIQPVVAIQDAGGNIVTSATNSITLAIGSGTSGATLTCTTNPRSTSSGVAVFSGCRIDRAGTYTLTASSPPGGPTTATSSSFIVTSNMRLSFGSYPSSPTPTLLTPQPTVELRDSSGFLVTSSFEQMTVVLTVSPATATFTCTSGTSRTTSSGIATFSGCTLPAGTGYQLTASPNLLGSPVTPVTGAAFTVVGTKLAFTQQPGGTNAVPGQALPTQPIVAVQSSAGAVLTAHNSGTVALTIATGPAGATLSCTNGNTRTVVNGYATFAGCLVSAQGTGYSLTATYTPTLAGELAVQPATSALFNVNASAAQIALSSSATIVNSGQGFTLTAQFAALGAGKALAFQRKGAADLDWVSFASVNTDASGRASTLVVPTYTAKYRASFAGAGGLSAGVSNIVSVSARFSSGVMTPNYTGTRPLARGTMVTYTATARPLNPGNVVPTITFQIYKQINGAWVFQTSATGPSNSSAMRSFSWTWSRSGTWYMRARINATAYNTAIFTNIARVSIP